MIKRESMTDKLRRMNVERQAPDPVELEADNGISEMPKPESRYPESRPAGVAHPDQGGRSDFLKVTVTMDPDDFEAVNAEMVRRKRAKEKGAQLSGCIREAVRFWRAAGMPRQS